MFIYLDNCLINIALRFCSSNLFFVAFSNTQNGSPTFRPYQQVLLLLSMKVFYSLFIIIYLVYSVIHPQTLITMNTCHVLLTHLVTFRSNSMLTSTISTMKATVTTFVVRVVMVVFVLGVNSISNTVKPHTKIFNRLLHIVYLFTHTLSHNNKKKTLNSNIYIEIESISLHFPLDFLQIGFQS